MHTKLKNIGYLGVAFSSALSMALSIVPVSHASAVPSTATFSDTADTWLGSATPTVGHGSSAVLNSYEASSSDKYRSLVRFPVSVPTANNSQIQSAQLTLTLSQNDTSSNFRVFAVDDSWSESAATWNNSSAQVNNCSDPYATNLIGVKIKSGTGTLVINLDPSAIPYSGDVSLCIYSGSSTPVKYNSRENAGTKPSLSVTYEQESKEFNFSSAVPHNPNITPNPGPALDSASSLVVSHLHTDHYWTNEDARGGSMIAVGRLWYSDNSGNLINPTLVDSSNTPYTFLDPEALAITPSGTMYLADSGGNRYCRSSIDVYSFTETTPTSDSTTIQATKTQYAWPSDNTEFKANRDSSLGPNVESMILDPATSKPYFIVKDTTGQVTGQTTTGIYTTLGNTAYPSGCTGAPHVLMPKLEKVGTFDRTNLGNVTDAAISNDGTEIAVLSHLTSSNTDYIDIYKINTNTYPVQTIESALAGTPLQLVPTLSSSQPQREGITFSADGKALELDSDNVTASAVTRVPIPSSYFVTAL